MISEPWLLDLDQDRARTRALQGMPRIDVGRQLAEAQKRHGRGRLSMLSEMTRLAAGPGCLMPAEYFIYRLFDASFSSEEKRSFVGKRLQHLVHRACTDQRWTALARDKLIFHGLMSGLGHPVPKLFAICHPQRSFAGAKALTDRAALRDFIRSLDAPVFAKPADGMYSVGCLSIDRADAGAGLVRLAFGQTASEGRLIDYIAGRPGGYLFQERLRPHREAERLTGPVPSTIRMLVLLGPDGPELLRALWKIPRGRNIADNFWRGNLLGALDPESGQILRAVSGVGIDQQLHERHPDTGARLLGASAPSWSEAKRLCLEAAAMLPGLRTQSWDIAIADRGPVIVEVNSGGDLNLPQIAHGRGLLDERYNAHLDRCGFRLPPLAVRVGGTLARRMDRDVRGILRRIGRSAGSRSAGEPG